MGGTIQIHQVVATLGYGDAIGNVALAAQRILRAAGWESDIFTESADRRLDPIARDYRELVEASRPENVLLHHFSLGSNPSRLAFALPDRMALLYHNVTPPEYFIGVHDGLVRECFYGRRELRAYADRCDLAIGASEFNRRELDALGFPRTDVLPVVPDFSHLAGPPHPLVIRMFDDDWTNVLTVGRVAPNKKVEDVIRFFHAYQKIFNRRSRLLIVGAHDGFESYVAWLRQLAATLGLEHVHFAGHVSNEELVAFYDVANLLLCASEHEGFCVPLIEAFYKQVPVLAYAAAAVPSTMDGAGVLFDRKDSASVAALMDAVVSDPGLEDAIVDGQLAAVARLQSKDFARTLLGFVDRILHGPRMAPPRVSPDFWRQFDSARPPSRLGR